MNTEIKEIKVTDEWPMGISDGLTLPCSVCGDIPKFDYHVDDEFWDDVIPRPFRRGVICLPCLDLLATDKGLNISTHIESIQFTAIEKTIVLHPSIVYYYREINSHERIENIRKRIETEHNTSDGPGGFGEVLCAHLHTFDMGFKDLAPHFNISMLELADIIADHIKRL